MGASEPSTGDVALWYTAASKLWRGLAVLAQAEVDDWIRHSHAVGQPLSEEGLELWMTRVQSGRCVVCGSKAAGKYCKAHNARK